MAQSFNPFFSLVPSAALLDVEQMNGTLLCSEAPKEQWVLSHLARVPEEYISQKIELRHREYFGEQENILYF